jgi:hypothetical protein
LIIKLKAEKRYLYEPNQNAVAVNRIASRIRIIYRRMAVPCWHGHDGIQRCQRVQGKDNVVLNCIPDRLSARIARCNRSRLVAFYTQKIQSGALVEPDSLGVDSKHDRYICVYEVITPDSRQKIRMLQ